MVENICLLVPFSHFGGNCSLTTTDIHINNIYINGSETENELRGGVKRRNGSIFILCVVYNTAAFYHLIPAHCPWCLIHHSTIQILINTLYVCEW